MDYMDLLKKRIAKLEKWFNDLIIANGNAYKANDLPRLSQGRWARNNLDAQIIALKDLLNIFEGKENIDAEPIDDLQDFLLRGLNIKDNEGEKTK